MSVGEIHVNSAWVVVALNTIAGIWALVAHRVEPARVKGLWIFTAVAQVSVMIQVTLGVIALQADGVEASGEHTLYGFLTLASVGIIYSYRQQIMEWQYLLYGLGSLFIAGLAIRAIFLTNGAGG